MIIILLVAKNRLARFIRDTRSIDSTALLGLLLFEIEIGTGIGIDFLHSAEWTDSHEAIGLVPSDGCRSVRRLFRTPMPHSRSKGRRRPVFRVPNPWRSIPVPVPISISIGCHNAEGQARAIASRLHPLVGPISQRSRSRSRTRTRLPLLDPGFPARSSA